MGRVYCDLEDAPEALHYFQKALDIAGDTKRYLLLSKIYSQMGVLYDNQGVYELAIPVLKKAYQYIILSGDSISMLFPFRDIARIYNVTGKQDSAILFYEKAYQLAFATENIKRATGIMIELSAIYRNLGKYNKAFECIQYSLKNKLDRNLIPTYASLGDLYLKMHKLDSADLYLKKSAKNCNNIYALPEIYDCLSQVEEARSNYKETVKYLRQYQSYQDSVKKITATEEIRKMSSLYNYQLKENENQKLIIENTKGKSFIQQLLIICIFLCIATFIFINRLRTKRKKAEEQTIKIQKERDNQYRESTAQIDENNLRIQQLESLLSQKEKNEDFLKQDLIQVQKELLSLNNRRIELRHTERDLLCINFKRSKVYEKFHSACHNVDIKITETDWICLQQELDSTYGSMTARLYELYPKLSFIELRICFLIKISIKVSDMALLLDRTKSTISSARNRLYTKLTGSEGSPEKLDCLISDL